MKKKEFTLPEGIELSENEQAMVDAMIAEFAAINEKIDAISPAEEASITEEDVEKQISELMVKFKKELDSEAKFKAIEDAMKEQGLALKKLEENESFGDRFKSIGQLYKEWHKKNPDAFKDLSRGTELKIQFKTAGNILNSTNIVAGTIPQAVRETGLNDVPVERQFIMDIIGTSPTTSKSIDFVEKKNQDGTVVFVLDTEAFAQIDFDLEVATSTAKDVGGFITVHENMIDDVDFMAAEIDKELVYMIKKAADTEILTGVGTTSHLKGITVYSSAAFSATDIQVVTPTKWDIIAAALANVRTVGFEEPDMILMHPTDYTNALGSKGSDGHYTLHPSLSPDGKSFEGIPISTTTFVTAGYLLVGNKMKSNIKILQDIELAVGYNLTGEFTKRLLTVRGAMRLHHYIKDNDTTAFLYDAFDDIKALIEVV